MSKRGNGNANTEEQQHREFMLAALRAASLRAKAWDADLTQIGVALRGGLIGADTALAWVRNAGLLWMVDMIPEPVGKIVGTDTPELIRPGDLPQKTPIPQNVEDSIRRMRLLADVSLGSEYEVECQREMRNACILLENAYSRPAKLFEDIGESGE